MINLSEGKNIGKNFPKRNENKMKLWQLSYGKIFKVLCGNGWINITNKKVGIRYVFSGPRIFLFSSEMVIPHQNRRCV